MTNQRRNTHGEFSRSRRLNLRLTIIILAVAWILFLFLKPNSTAETIIEPILSRSSETPPTLVELKEAGEFTIYAYNSVPEQTDGSPCISADNKDICERFAKGEKMVATNDFPLGTELFLGDLGRFIVVDRMNERYSKTIDIFMGYDIAKAKEFGKKKMTVFVAK